LACTDSNDSPRVHIRANITTPTFSRVVQISVVASNEDRDRLQLLLLLLLLLLGMVMVVTMMDEKMPTSESAF
jgi:nitrate reductase gamma subunit